MRTAKEELIIVFCVLIFAMLTPFSLDGYAPSLPSITTALHTHTSMTQLTMSLYLFGSAFSQLIYGPMSDKLGRKKLVLSGVLLCFFGSILCALSKTILSLIVARFIQGAGAGASNALFRAVMRDTFSGSRMAKVASYLSMGFTVSLAFAPVLGGYLEVHFGWQAIFIFMIGFSALVGITLFIWLPETNAQFNPEAMHPPILMKNYFTLLTHRAFLGYTLCSTLAFTAFIVYYAIGPFLLENDLGLTPVQFGYLSILTAVAVACGQMLNVRYVMKIGSDGMLRFGVYLLLFSGASLLFMGMMHYFNVVSVIAPILLMSIAAGLVFANAMAGAFQPFPHMAGIAGAAYGCLQILGSATTSSFAALLPPNYFTFAGVEFCLGVAAWLLIRFVIPKERY